MDVKKIINWSAVSSMLTGKPKRVSANYVPKKHRYNVWLLEEKIKQWIEEVKQ